VPVRLKLVSLLTEPDRETLPANGSDAVPATASPLLESVTDRRGREKPLIFLPVAVPVRLKLVSLLTEPDRETLPTKGRIAVPATATPLLDRVTARLGKEKPLILLPVAVPVRLKLVSLPTEPDRETLPTKGRRPPPATVSVPSEAIFPWTESITKGLAKKLTNVNPLSSTVNRIEGKQRSSWPQNLIWKLRN